MTPEPIALVVDDDPDFRDSLEALVAREGFATRAAGTLADAHRQIEESAPDLVLVDLSLPDGDGSELLRESEDERREFVVITGHASVDSAVTALRDGALDYLTKPLDRSRLRTVLANVARTRQLKQEVGSLRSELRELGRFGRLVGRSKPMQEVYDLVARVAPTNAAVLVMGESGTGKELVAETIHDLSRRREGPFLAMNCGAVSPTLIESELFGHERGSFTGAERRRSGYFERAHGGTLLLDEITEMSAELQVKLLRVLETGKVVRVGGSDPTETDVRIVAATNQNPEEAVRSGKLREDLFYRINVFPIALPPLRSRKEDIDLLAQHFLEACNREEGSARRWSPDALERLRQLPWTGNVRELKHAVQRAYILGGEEVGPEALSLSEASAPSAAEPASPALEVRPGTKIADMEKALILATLEELDGNKKRAAEMLGISLKTLYNRLNVYRAADGDA